MLLRDRHSCETCEDRNVAKVLFYCCRKSALDCNFLIKNALERKCSLSARQRIVNRKSFGQTMLSICIVRNNMELAKFIIDECGASVSTKVADNFRNVEQPSLASRNDSVTPLHIATVTSNVDFVKMLLQRGADVDDVSVLHLGNYSTALMSARAPEIMRVLLDFGARIDMKDITGKTALHLAVRRNDFECVELLLRNGADPKIKDKSGIDSLQACSFFHRFEILELIRPFFPSRLYIEALEMAVVMDYLETQILRKNDLIFALDLRRVYGIEKPDVGFPHCDDAPFASADELNANTGLWCDRQCLLICLYANPARFEMVGTKLARKYFGRNTDSDSNNVGIDMLMLVAKTLEKNCGFRDFAFKRVLESVTEFTGIASREANIDVDILNSFLEFLTKCLERVGYVANDLFSTDIVFTLVTLLTLAVVNYKDDDFVRGWVRRLLDLNVRLKDGKGLLHVLFFKERMLYFYSNVTPPVRLVKMFVECGADVNAQDDEKNTPLHILCDGLKTATHLVRELNILGAHVDARNCEGCYPACYWNFKNHLLFRDLMQPVRCTHRATDRKNKVDLDGPVTMNRVFPLTCLAARSVPKELSGHLPQQLKALVKFH